jgi:phosphoribosylpyrophosphate synthetase
MEPLKVRDANVFSPNSRGQSQEQVIAGLLLIKGALIGKRRDHPNRDDLRTYLADCLQSP